MKANWNWGNNTNPNTEFFSSLVDNFINKDFDKVKDVFETLGKNFKDWSKDFESNFKQEANQAEASAVSMNIIESPTHFRLEVAAPGLKKEDFKVNIQGKKLSIRVKREFTILNKDEQFLQKEFDYSNFERIYDIPDAANTDRIEASYHNGVLVLNIAKKEEAIEKPAREIVID